MTVLWRPSVDAADNAISRLRNKMIIAVRRRGKALVLDLDGGMHLLLHPMMTGRLVVAEQAVTVFAGGHPSRSMLDAMPNATTRVVLSLSEDTVVFFNDQRKFGWIRILDTAALRGDPFLARLGPEPLGDTFTVDGFREQLAAHPRAPIKAVLLDQPTVAGLGNIYVDESLHLARIHPRRLAGSLSMRESAALHGAIRTALSAAVSDGGTSFAEYVKCLSRAGQLPRVGRRVPAGGPAVPGMRRDHRTNTGGRARHELLPTMPVVAGIRSRQPFWAKPW